MRRFTLALCAVALVSCSDHASPTAAVVAAARPVPGAIAPDSILSVFGKADSKTIVDRVTDLVATRFAKVTLPPDNFSLSADAVHPDVACSDALWNGARCWMMYTPYKNGDSGYENPGLLIASNDTVWKTPATITNPLVPWPGLNAYNSDPDHAFDSGKKRLTQVYRVVSDSFNKIMIMSTTNAKTWTTARVAFKEVNHDAISPSLVIDDDREATIWYVRAGTAGCNATSSSIALRTARPDSGERVDEAAWSAAKTVKLSVPNSVIWHLDVESLPNDRGYVALVVAYPKGSTCGSSDLWLATSPDGVTWRTFAMPMLWRGMSVARRRSIATWYRGTLQYDERTDTLHVWPSGLSGTNWTIYHTAFKLSDMLGLLSAAEPNEVKSLFESQRGIRATVAMP